MSKTRPVILILGSLGVSCSTPTDALQNVALVSFSVVPTTAAPGDTLQLILANSSRATIAVNLCSTSLERQVGADWLPVTNSTSGVCQVFLHTLNPGDRDTGVKALSSSLASGTYRLQTSVEIRGQDAMASLTSSPFAVQP